MIRWWVGNPVAANLLMWGLLLGGLLGLKHIDHEIFPTVRPDSVELTIRWPGASPADVERDIVRPVERALRGTRGVQGIYSQALSGIASLVITAPANADMTAFTHAISRAVQALDGLPSTSDRPVIKPAEWRQMAVQLALVGDRAGTDLTAIARALRDDLQAFSAIGQVHMSSATAEEWQVTLSEAALQRYDLTFTEVIGAIRSQVVNFSLGAIDRPAETIQLRALHAVQVPSDLQSVVIRQGDGGERLTLGDVADIAAPPVALHGLARVNGLPAVLLSIEASEGARIDEVSEAIRGWLVTARAHLPAGTELRVWSDGGKAYDSRMEQLLWSALQGLLLVFLLLALTLDPKVALWTTVGIAVAVLGTFAWLPALGVSLNVVSTFALLLVLGVIVDDAIVVGESIARRAGVDPTGHAAVRGATQMARPLIFAVLTTIVAFLPWLFLSDGDTRIVRQLAIVIVVALGVSLVEALLILPAHLRTPGSSPGRGRVPARRRAVCRLGVTALARRVYRPVLFVALRQGSTTVSVFAALSFIALGLVASHRVPHQFMPQLETDHLAVNVVLREGMPLEQALSVLQRVEVVISNLNKQALPEQQEEDLQSPLVVDWYARAIDNRVTAELRLGPDHREAAIVMQVSTAFRIALASLPEVQEVHVDHTRNQAPPRLAFQLRHDDLSVLREASRAFAQRLQKFTEIIHIDDGTASPRRELQLRLKAGASQSGLTLAEIGRQVRQAFQGEEVLHLPTAQGPLRVMIGYPQQTKTRLSSLSEVRIRGPRGQRIPLLSLVDITYGWGAQRILREDGQRYLRVAAQVSGASIGPLSQAIDASVIPAMQKRYPGLSVRLDGVQAVKARFFSELGSAYLLALFVMYALLAVALRSYALPLLIALVLPFGFVGAVLAHLLFSVPLSLFSYFGIAAASAVVVNDNLVLLHCIRRHEQRGRRPIDAIVRGATERFRPVLLTSATTVVGLIPALLDPSPQLRFLHPALLAMVGGVLLALAVSLLLLPCLYLLQANRCLGSKLYQRHNNAPEDGRYPVNAHHA